MLYCILQSWNAIWLNTGEITADLCHVVVLFSSVKADDEHISLKAFLLMRLFCNLLRCSRSKCLDYFLYFFTQQTLYTAYFLYATLHNALWCYGQDIA